MFLTPFSSAFSSVASGLSGHLKVPEMLTRCRACLKELVNLRTDFDDAKPVKVVAAFFLPAALVLITGCGPTATTQKPLAVESPRDRTLTLVPTVRFSDVTEKAGIRFVHTNGSYGKKLLPETMGSGVAFLDFNKDGKQDLLFVNSCYWPGHEEKGTIPTLALYRNDSTKGEIKFTDVTKEYGLDVTMFGMGVTVGDYDNDGWPDIFVTGVGGNRLFHNVEGKRFEDVTAKARVGGPGGWSKDFVGDFLTFGEPEKDRAGNVIREGKRINWSTSAAWLDYDGDGTLDLFVCNYVVWSPYYDLTLESLLKGANDRAFGRPESFPGSQCFLYRNKGDGTFEDVSREAGVQVTEWLPGIDAATPLPVGRSLGVIVADVDEDGHPDIIVVNDTVRNFFFHNKGDGTFEEKRQAFADAALIEELAAPSRQLLKFGTFFFDYDLDGRLDLLTCKGHWEPAIAKVQPGQRHAHPTQLCRNTGENRQRFEPVTAEAVGPDLFQPIVGRGSAFADIDGDGCLDVVLTNNGGAPKLLRNEGGTGHHWVRLLLEGDGKRSNKSAIGARVTLEAGGLVQHREVTSARGYLSQSELPVTFGLGQETKVDKVTIRWPGKDGGETVLTDVPVDQARPVVQGK